MPIGLNVLNAGIILGLMAAPIMTSIAEDALKAVPDRYREAAEAMGATRWQVVYKVVLPAAKNGLLGAVLLGVGRGFGETMAVLMATGHSHQPPHERVRLGPRPHRDHRGGARRDRGGVGSLPGAVHHRDLPVRGDLHHQPVRGPRGPRRTQGIEDGPMFQASELNHRDRRTQRLYQTLFLVMTVLLILPVVIILGTLIFKPAARSSRLTSCSPIRSTG